VAATLWNVEIASLAGSELRADVERVHEDAGPFPQDRVFALRMLYEQVRVIDASGQFSPIGPLGEAVSEEDIYDDEWLRTHAADYISGVSVDLPEDADAVGAVARYDMTATSPRWLEHLHSGQSWRSAAFS
jgi:hypothetical protein